MGVLKRVAFGLLFGPVLAALVVIVALYFGETRFASNAGWVAVAAVGCMAGLVLAVLIGRPRADSKGWLTRTPFS